MPPDRNRFALGTAIFLRFLALIHLVAFLSLWVQLPGLLGPHGLLPAPQFLSAVRQQLGADAAAQLPTLCWFFGAGPFLHVLCAIGVLAATALLAGFSPAACLVVLWLAYLSLVGVGQVFFAFQWDSLLLETTLLALFVAPWSLRNHRWKFRAATARYEPSRFAHFLLRWLLFRLMFLSGVVKLTSGDPTWRNFTALTFHYETQPIPNPLAWWAHQLPLSVQRAACAGMFVIELFVPFFLFAPRPLRHNAALLLAALQLSIALTGNFAFFNLLTLALCLACLDDAFWSRLLPRKCNTMCYTAPSPENAFASPPPATDYRTALKLTGTVFIVLYTLFQALPAIVPGSRPPAFFNALAASVAPFRSLNTYGLFAVMTTTRPELVFEGSDDRRDWKPYELPYKPGDRSRRPPFVAPHQPRLDWQLWFAALGSPEQNPFVYSVCEHLLRGTPEVLALFARNPFPDHPPRYLRVVRYQYHFTTPAERARTGRWWRREPLDFYLSPASLR